MSARFVPTDPVKLLYEKAARASNLRPRDISLVYIKHQILKPNQWMRELESYLGIIYVHIINNRMPEWTQEVTLIYNNSLSKSQPAPAVYQPESAPSQRAPSPPVEWPAAPNQPDEVAYPDGEESWE